MRYSAEHKTQTRDKLLASSGALAKRGGFSATGVDGLMKAIGLTGGAFYGHFASKDALFAAIVEREGLKQESDTGAIEAAVDAVLAANADKVAEYRGGKEALFGFFVGQTMKASGGKANPAMLNEMLKQKLSQ